MSMRVKQEMWEGEEKRKREREKNVRERRTPSSYHKAWGNSFNSDPISQSRASSFNFTFTSTRDILRIRQKRWFQNWNSVMAVSLHRCIAKLNNKVKDVFLYSNGYKMLIVTSATMPREDDEWECCWSFIQGRLDTSQEN